MSIQDIAITNNQKKKLLNSIKDKHVLVQEDDGNLVVNVAAYVALKNSVSFKKTGFATIEEILGADILDFDAEYFVFN